VSWKKIVIIEIVHEDYHGPKGTSPKSGRKEKKMKIREITSNTQYPRQEKGMSNIERSNIELRRKERKRTLLRLGKIKNFETPINYCL
jgi:hypothetical protein